MTTSKALALLLGVVEAATTLVMASLTSIKTFPIQFHGCSLEYGEYVPGLVFSLLCFTQDVVHQE